MKWKRMSLWNQNECCLRKMQSYRCHSFSHKTVGICLVGNKDGRFWRPRKVDMAGIVCATRTWDNIGSAQVALHCSCKWRRLTAEVLLARNCLKWNIQCALGVAVVALHLQSLCLKELLLRGKIVIHLHCTSWMAWRH